MVLIKIQNIQKTLKASESLNYSLFFITFNQSTLKTTMYNSTDQLLVIRHRSNTFYIYYACATCMCLTNLAMAKLKRK